MYHKHVLNYLWDRKLISFWEMDTRATLTQFSFRHCISAASIISLVILSLYFAMTCVAWKIGVQPWQSLQWTPKWPLQQSSVVSQRWWLSLSYCVSSMLCCSPPCNYWRLLNCRGSGVPILSIKNKIKVLRFKQNETVWMLTYLK